MFATINWNDWFCIFGGVFFAAFGFWQIRQGKAFGNYGKIYERDEKPVSFWISVGITFGVSIFIIIATLCHWR
jgi:hypothetical protein